MADPTTSELRADFFNWLYGTSEGYVCIAYAALIDPRKNFKQKFYHWPSQKGEMETFLYDMGARNHLWFCVNLLNEPVRKKEMCANQNVVWSDLDTCDPSIVEPAPSIVIVSSPDRYQAIWKLDQIVPTGVAEDYSRRIAYKYNQNGADASGWDLTQLLRVPYSTNFKYVEKPLVQLRAGESDKLGPALFEAIDAVPISGDEIEDIGDVPDLNNLISVDTIFYKYQPYLDSSFFELFELEPKESDDWSTRMWKLINLCFEAGMVPDEVFSVAYSARCNKYIRERRPIRFLWLEVLKCNKVQRKLDLVAGTWQPLLMPQLVDPDICERDTFIDKYHEWAIAATDAVEVYHEISAAILLSATLAGYVKLEVNYDTIVPNLWGLILGESTLTRKTTAMKMAVKILQEVDPDVVAATDGTAEGLMTKLSERPGKVSLFYKDEVSGFFDGINRKDYLAAMPETLTQLYDCPPILSRMLRKEQIVVQNPVFIFFGGGIAERTYGFLSDNLIYSGFLPRFLVVNGYADLSRLRPTGPPTMQGVEARERLVNELRDLQDEYRPQGFATIAGQKVPVEDLMDRPKIDVIPTQSAWEKIAEIERVLIESVQDHHYADRALPTFERMSHSVQKLATLIAASRQFPIDGKISLEKRDVDNAARYIQDWGRFSIELLMNAGKTQALRLLEKVRTTIDTRPGVFKSDLMRMHHLSSVDINTVIGTLIDRGEITRSRKGRSEQYWIVHG